jgi:hypothetical protein
MKNNIHLIDRFMKKIVILLFAVCALFAFSCNKYCNCKHYIDGELDPDYKGNFIKESNLNCADYSTELKEIDGITYEVKCK